MFEHLPRARLATLPTPLERGPELPGGARLWVKRDDLTGLGVGGNKARKLEFLCGDAISSGARCLVTVGAAQSNHCRMTAAAGAVLGLDVHLVLSGDQPPPGAAPFGNQLLSQLFGAHLHHTGAAAAHWGELAVAQDALVDQLWADGAAPASIPIGGSAPIGAIGYVLGFVELMEQCATLDVTPSAIVTTSSSGGTHAGLLAGRALWIANEREATGGGGGGGGGAGDAPPDVIAIGVAKGVIRAMPDPVELANAALDVLGRSDVRVTGADVEIDPNWLGDDYAVPTAAGDDAIRWAALRGGWVLDRTYSGKGFAGLLGHARSGRWARGDDVVFVHTGGLPAVFAPGGAPVP